jgi:hypothetical protein
MIELLSFSVFARFFSMKVGASLKWSWAFAESSVKLQAPHATSAADGGDQGRNFAWLLAYCLQYQNGTAVGSQTKPSIQIRQQLHPTEVTQVPDEANK